MDNRDDRPRGKYGPADDPTTDEIAERCLQVQERWSERERRNRAGMTQIIWQPQKVEFNLDRQCVLESFS